jgi:hypothetical protein
VKGGRKSWGHHLHIHKQGLTMVVGISNLHESCV